MLEIENFVYSIIFGSSPAIRRSYMLDTFRSKSKVPEGTNYLLPYLALENTSAEEHELKISQIAQPRFPEISNPCDFP